jgi:hypothetical protein
VITGGLVPVLPSCLLEPLWDRFAALLPEHVDTYPLGCHNPRIPDRVVFDHVIADLESPSWVREGRPLVLIGDSGTGKSHRKHSTAQRRPRDGPNTTSSPLPAIKPQVEDLISSVYFFFCLLLLLTSSCLGS